MMVQFSLPSPAFVVMLLANLMRSGRACMLPLGLRPPKGPSCNLCMYHRWFARIGPVPEPYFRLSISARCMRRLFCFRLGAYALPIEMGRRLRMAWDARVCPLCLLCLGMHVGDERHYVLECPAFDDIHRGFQHLFDDSHEAMRLLMWHLCQKDVASCLLQLLGRIDESLTRTIHCVPSALLAAWTEFISLSLSPPLSLPPDSGPEADSFLIP